MRAHRSVILAVAGLALTAVAAAPTAAGQPGYMKLKPRVGLGVEVKGRLNDAGLFAASDIEALDEPRSPKLRGRLGDVDHAAGTVVMFGMTIDVNDRTEVTGKRPADLRAGDRVEMKVHVDGATGRWRARSIETGDIKDSNKIKATITAMWVDGVAPDTLSLDGLLVLLDDRTDFDQTAMLEHPIEEDLFDDLSLPDATYADGGWITPDGRQRLYAEYRHNSLRSEDFDLSDRYESDRDETTPELRARWSGYWSPTVRTYADLRVRHQFTLASDQDLPDEGVEASLSQAYVLARNLGGRGLAVQAGRQRFDEPREWIFDEYLDAVRGYIYGGGAWDADVAYVHGDHALKEKFRTWTDYFARVNWRPGEDHTLSAWMLKRLDSDEDRNREPVWWGARYLGRPHRLLDVWADAAIMRGEDKHRPVRGWAIDTGGTLLMRDVSAMPSVSVAYALGSGDESGADGIDHGFRQTGYQDNSARFGGVASVRYYGLALDPELSNLEVLTAAVGVRPRRDASIELVWHRYRQHHPDDDLRGDLVDPPARPNGVSDDIGWGADLVLGFPRLWDLLSASFTYGVFQPGEAYAPRRNRAHLVKLNITMRFWTS